MEQLRNYLNSLSVPEQNRFCDSCGTSVGYIRKAISKGQRIGEAIVIAIERESHGAVRCESIRPDVDWGYLRGTASVDHTEEQISKEEESCN